MLDDLAETALIPSVKAGYFTRLLTKKANPKKMHPNPRDEFSDPNIGPNDEIVHNYMDEMLNAQRIGINPRFGKVIVEKLSKGGYRILNGHHR